MSRGRLSEGIPVDPLDSSQEPYVHIIAPNIDHISRDTFRRGTVERRRALRGLAVFGIAVGVVVVIVAIGSVIAWSQGW